MPARVVALHKSHAGSAPLTPLDRAAVVTSAEGRRGRFARVLEGGPIAVGDPIAVEPPV